MKTLIEIEDTPSSYTYELIINDTEQNLSLKYTQDIKDIERNIGGKLAFFTKNGCEKCVYLKKILEEKRIQFKDFNLDEDPTLEKQFLEFIEPYLENDRKITFPVIYNKDYVIFGYDKIDDLLKELQ